MTFASEVTMLTLSGKVETTSRDALIKLIDELKSVKEDIDFSDAFGVTRVLKNATTKAHVVRNDAENSIALYFAFKNGNEVVLNFGSVDDVTYSLIDAMPRVSRWSILARAVVVAMNNIVEELEADVDIEDTKEEDFCLEFDSMEEFKEVVTDIAVRALRNTATVPDELVEELVDTFAKEIDKVAEEVLEEVAEKFVEGLDGCDGECCPDCQEDCTFREEKPEPKKAYGKDVDIDELINGFIAAIKSFEDSFNKVGGK